MQIFLGFSILIVGAIYLIILVRKNLLTPKYIYMWLLSLAIIGFLLLSPRPTGFVQAKLDFVLKSNFIFSVAFTILFLTIIQISKDLVLQIRKVEKIIERIALIEIDIQDRRET